jgi:O-antigen/teichoic acid export membrane protein
MNAPAPGRLHPKGAAGASPRRTRFPLAGPHPVNRLARVAGAGAAFGLHALLARLAGVEQYGTFSYVLAWLAIAVTVACLGLDLSVVRFVAAYRARADWRRLRGLRAWSGRVPVIAACVIAGGAALLLNAGGPGLDAALVRTGRIACLVVPAAVLLRLSEARLGGLQRVALAHLPDALFRPALMAGLVALASAVPGDPLTSAAAMGLHLVAMAAAAGLCLAFERRHRPPIPPDTEARYEVREWLRASVPLWAWGAIRLLSSRLDLVLLAAFTGMAEVGIYAVARRLAELIAFGAGAVQTTARPLLAERHGRGDRRGVQRAASVAAGWAALFAGAACCVLIPARTPLLGLFGPEFVRGAAVLLVLAAGQLVIACTAVVDSLLIATGRERPFARITLAVFLLKLPLIWLAIAWWGVVGAALAESASVVVGRLWGWAYARRTLDMDGSVLGWFRIAADAAGVRLSAFRRR